MSTSNLSTEAVKLGRMPHRHDPLCEISGVHTTPRDVVIQRVSSLHHTRLLQTGCLALACLAHSNYSQATQQ